MLVYTIGLNLFGRSLIKLDCFYRPITAALELPIKFCPYPGHFVEHCKLCALVDGVLQDKCFIVHDLFFGAIAQTLLPYSCHRLAPRYALSDSAACRRTSGVRWPILRC